MAAEMNFPREYQMLMPALAQPLARVAAIHFEPGQTTYALDSNCIGVEVPFTQPRLSRSDQHPIAIYHAGHILQVWATTPRLGSIRVLIADYHLLARKRQIIGYITIGHVPGDIRVSDFRHPISIGIIPSTLRADTVYILGIRFEKDQDDYCMPIPADVVTYDQNEGKEFIEQLEFNYHGYEQTFIRCSAAISTRVNIRHHTNRPHNTQRYPSENLVPTLSRPLSANVVRPSIDIPKPTRFAEPVPRIPLASPTSSNQLRLTQTPSTPNATRTISNEPSDSNTSVVSVVPTGTVTNPVSGAISRPQRQPPTVVRQRPSTSDKKPPLVCHTCETVVHNRHDLSAHMHDCHSPSTIKQRSTKKASTPFRRCQMCTAGFGSIIELQEHMRTHLPSRMPSAHIPDRTQRGPINPAHPYWTERDADTPLTREEELQNQAMQRFNDRLYYDDVPEILPKAEKAWSMDRNYDPRAKDTVEMDKMSDCGTSIVSEIIPTVANQPIADDDTQEDYFSVTDEQLHQRELEEEEKDESD